MLLLLGGMIAAAPADKPAPVKTLRASIGVFYPHGDTDRERTTWNISYPTKLHLGILPAEPRLYVDSTRKKTIVPVTSTTNTVTVTTLQGIGLSWMGHGLGVTGSHSYTFSGLGLYTARTVLNGNAKSGTSIGGKLGIGYEQKDAFVEADYTLVSRIQGSDPSGLALRIGFRL